MDSAMEEPLTALQQCVADRARELSTLHAIARTISQSLDLDSVLPNALDWVLESLRLEAGAIYLKALQTGELEQIE